MDKKTFVTLTLILTFTFTLAAYIRADGRSNRIPDITGEYYRQIEKDYVADIREKLDDINREYRNLQTSHQVVVEENNWLHAENNRLKDEIIMLRKDIDELKAVKDKG